ncbi:MAG: hypothetical protein NTY36_01525 [Deltaproteobacteria bacterium]|nr:hypothetical protein [Deltaproteobacteria bacterium]
MLISLRRLVVLAIVLLFALVAISQAAETSMKEMYLIVSKYAKADINRVEFEKAMGNAEAEFDLFKDSKIAKKNPEFTEHIAKAMEAIKSAGFFTFVAPSPKGSQQREAAWKATKRELEAAKQYLK